VSDDYDSALIIDDVDSDSLHGSTVQTSDLPTDSSLQNTPDVSLSEDRTTFRESYTPEIKKERVSTLSKA